MSSSASKLANAYTTPWTLRVYEALPGNPFWVGIGFTGALLVGAASYLIIGVAVTNVTTPVPANPWDWRAWNYDVFWHRVSTVFFVWWFACLCHVSVVESVRLSRLSDKLESLDLFELGPYQPLVRQGLTNALLVIGMLSIMSLRGLDLFLS
jgi:hypothetical protein